jgi:hypothetical protein
VATEVVEVTSTTVELLLVTTVFDEVFVCLAMVMETEVAVAR